MDMEAVRREFWRLDRSGGAPRTDRIPTREDILARWHWRLEGTLAAAGKDPRKSGVGRHGNDISGKGEVIPWDDIVQPLEKRFRYAPMPMEWFDNDIARAVLFPMDPDHLLLESLIARHLAGYSGRPSPRELFDWLTLGMTDDRQRGLMSEMLTTVREHDYPQLRRRDAISAWHIARAVHDCGLERGALSRWLNQFAVRSDGWVGVVPGGEG